MFNGFLSDLKREANLIDLMSEKSICFWSLLALVETPNQKAHKDTKPKLNSTAFRFVFMDSL